MRLPLAPSLSIVVIALLSLAACGDDSSGTVMPAATTGGSSGTQVSDAGIGGAPAAGGQAGAGGSAGGQAGSSGTSGAAGAGGPIGPDTLAVVADTDRDGDIDGDDLPGRSLWSWTRGAFLVANLDDDDGDGVSDAADDTANGTEDIDDLAPLRVELGSSTAASASTLHLIVLSGAQNVRVFRVDGAGYALVDGPIPSSETALFAVEAKRFAGPDWDGLVRLRVEARDSQDAELASDQVELRVAPWIMLPSSAAPSAVHVARDAYSNQSFLDDLGAAAATAGVTLLQPFATAHWQEMWMQDTMEIGYTQLPGRAPMHVALRANRGQDAYPKTLLGPGMGYLEIGAPRSAPGGDAWVDWYGNLEVSPPVPGWPLGRIYYGHNTATGMKLHPDVVAFLEAQAVQSPFWIDTSWLTIKHVDEIITFLPHSDGTPRLLVASPREAGLLYPSYYGSYNKGIQESIDRSIHGGSYAVQGATIDDPGVLKHLNLTEAAIVEIPLFYTDGHSDWSNPINGLYLGGYYVAGETDIFTPERKVTATRIEALGIHLVWVDDAVYQHNLGNVHCATNSTRTPLVAQFVMAIPDSIR